MYKNIDANRALATAVDALEYGHLAGNGSTADLEALLCSFYGAKHALCVDSATNGLMYLLLATGLGRREILTTPLTFGGTIAGALTLDCKVHFADIDDTLNLCPESAQEMLSQNKGIKAIIAVDFAGNPHRMQALHDICSDLGVWHFVDAAQSFGADYGRKDVSDLNDAMVVSFGSGKAVFAGGEGGAIITNNTALYERLLSVCQHAHRQERDLGIGFSHDFALNGRMHPIAATLACLSFESGLAAIRAKRELFNEALGVLSTFDSVSSIFNQRGSAFYHCPFMVEDERFLNEEFSSPLLKGFRYERAPFIPLPLQLDRVGLGKRMKSCSYPRLERIINSLFLLHRME